MPKVAKKPSFKRLLQMTNLEARAFFLKGESYYNFDLPKYFIFDELLADISKQLLNKELSSFYEPKLNPSHFEDVNHKILHNKDGKYSWRPFKLINPVLYVGLVHKITELKNWATILNRFHEYFKNGKIECTSLPVEAISDKSSDKAKQINLWWKSVEQKSLKLSLEYEYVVKTDISDCYGAIYTHSLAWALHGKDEAKKHRKNRDMIGNAIDILLTEMSHGQTNGIPQGSVLMDFVAEIVLGYADELLTKKIDGKVKNYHIVRYRDDYRIFINSPVDGDILIKYLSEVLGGLGLKINPNKTISSPHVIRQSVKEDKWFWISQNRYHSNIQKHLLIIHNLAEQYPNCGSLITALSGFNKRIAKCRKINGDSVILLISIVVDIACNNPKVYPQAAAILSKLISLLSDKGEKKRIEIFKKIKLRFDKIPNSGHLQIWLQRITFTIDRNYPYDEILCKMVAGDQVEIWNFDWLKKNFSNKIDTTKIIDHEILNNLPDVINQKEIMLFNSEYSYN